MQDLWERKMETWLQGMDGFSYCMEMLAAALCFFIFLKKRKGFWLRVGASAIMLFLASLLIYPYFVDIMYDKENIVSTWVQ